jgi:hypothetical protein
MTIARRIVLAALGLVGLVPVGARAQSPDPYRASIHVRVDWLQLDYSGGRIPAGGVILKGEPLVLEVSIANQLRGSAAGAEADWPSRMSLTLQGGGQFDKNRPLLVDRLCQERLAPLHERLVTVQDDTVLLEYGGSQTFRCEIDLASYGLAPGQYTLSPAWSNAALTARTFRRTRASDTPDVIGFEYRDIRTAGDALDLDLHLARRAFFDAKASAEAIRLADKVLAREPSSSSALVIRGHARQALGQCAEARADWRRAGAVLALGTGDGVGRTAASSPEQRQRLREDWERRASQMRCP